MFVPSVKSPRRQTYTVRYVSTLSGSANYTAALTSDVIASLLSTATVNGTGSPTVFLPYLDAVRLHKISMYVQDATTSSGNAITVTGSFPATPVSNLSFGSRLVQKSATIMGNAGAASIHLVPDRKSPQGNIIGGQSSSNIFFAYDISCGNATSSVIVMTDITFSGQIPTNYAVSSSPTTFSFNASPISTVKGQVYAQSPFTTLGGLASTSAGYAVNYAPLV
jgi:hypothetical protein